MFAFCQFAPKETTMALVVISLKLQEHQELPFLDLLIKHLSDGTVYRK